MSQSIQIPVTQVGLQQSIIQGVREASKKANFSLGGLGSGGAAQKINAISQPLGRITGQADEFSKSMAAANARVLAFGASAGIMAGVSAALAGVVKSAINVEQKLTSINTVLQTSSAQLEKFGDSIFDIAKNTGQSFDIVAEGALELARQGLSATDTLSRLNDALILSRLSGLDATKSVEGLTAAYNSFQGAGETTATILNKLVVVSQKYAVSEKDLIEGVKRSASVADLAGVSFDQLLGVITAVQQKTARGGAVIGNSFKTIFARIQDKGVLTDLQDLGVEVVGTSKEILPATQILGNLSKQFGQLSKIQQTDLAKKLGGIYQLDKLLAGLEDLSSANSVARESAELAATAQNQAYEKNLLLNQTLAEVINRVTINAQELGAKLGALGVTDSLKNILSFFNSLLEGVQNLLGEESGLGKFVRGIVKGISDIITGPGLALFAAIIVKLSKDLVVFGAQSLKSFFGIGKAAKDIKDLETSIKSALSSNVDLQQQILKLENDRYGQMKLITAEIKNQEVEQGKLEKISSGLAAPAYKYGFRAGEQGLRFGSPQGLRFGSSKNTAAEGYIPAFAQEKKNIQKGVGGAKSGDKPVTLENFNFGGGKKGSVVAHTGEYIVPNFGGGSGSAIFNRDMVKKMGLPSGARKINAAGGFIPNFAEKYKKGGERTLEDSRKYFQKQKKETAIAAFENPDTSENDLIGASESLAKGKNLTYDFDASKFQFGNGMGIGLVALQDGSIGGIGRGKLTSDSADIQEKLNAIGVPNLSKVLESKFRERNIDPSRFIGVKADLLQAKPNIAFDKIKIGSVNALKNQFSSETFNDFQQTVNRLFARPISDLGNELFGPALGSVPSGDVSDKYIFGKDVLGSIFESATQFYIKGADNLPSFQDGEATRNQRFDFPMGNAEEAKRLNSLFFKNGGVGIAEAKLTANASTLNSVVSKGLNNQQVVSQMKQQIASGSKVSMAGGFIPNFASYDELIGQMSSYQYARIKNQPAIDKRLKSLAEKYTDLEYLGSGAESHAFKSSSGDVYKLPARIRRSGFNSAKDKALNSNYFPFDEANKQLIANGSNLRFPLANKQARSVITSQQFAGPVLPQVIKDANKSDEVMLQIEKSYNEVKNRNKISPNLLRSFGLDTGSDANFTFFNPLSDAQKEIINLQKTSAKEVFKNNIFGLIDPVQFNTDVAKEYRSKEFAAKNQSVKAGGYIPNFADPLKDAVDREMAAGVPSSQIYVDKNSSLKNAMNPMGLMVANRRDEPAGGIQGINRARKEGANPMMYGAAGGFIPNFAPKKRYKSGVSQANSATTTQAANTTQAAQAAAAASVTQAVNTAQAAQATASLATIMSEYKTEVDALIKTLNKQIQTGKITRQQAGEALEKVGENKLKGQVSDSRVQKLTARSFDKLVPDTASKGMSDFVGKLFLMQSVASGVTASLSELGQEYDKYGQAFASFTAGTLSIMQFLDMFKDMGVKQAVGQSSTKNFLSANTQRKRNAALAEMETVAASGVPGAPGGVSRFLARRAATVPTGAVSKGIGGASRIALSVISGVGPIFGRLIPIVGIALTAFQAVSGIVKLFGFDLNKIVADGLTKFGQSLGIIATDSQKLADSFAKNSKEVAVALNTGTVEKGNLSFQKTIEKSLTKASEKELQSKLRDKDEKKDEENYQKNFTDQLLRDQSFKINKKLFSERSGLDEKRLEGQYKTQGFVGLQSTTLENLNKRASFDERYVKRGVSLPQGEAIANLDKDLIAQFSSAETQKEFQKAVDAKDVKQQEKLIDQLSEEAFKKLEDLGKTGQVANLKQSIAGGGNLDDLKILQDIEKERLALFSDVVKASEVQKQLNLVDLQIAQQKLDNLIKYKTALMDLPSIRDNELSIQKELINTTDAQKLSIERELTARKAVVDLTKQQSDAAYTFLKDQGAIQAILQKAGINDATVESFGDLSDILNGVTDQIRLQGGYTEDVKQKTREILKERLNNTVAEEKITALLNEQMDGLFKQQQIQLGIQDIELKRNSIIEARNALLKMENDQKLLSIDSIKEELSYQEKIQDINTRSFKTRADALKEVSPQSIKFDVEGLQNARDIVSARSKNANQQQSIFRDLQKDLLGTALEKNFTQLAGKIEAATNLDALKDFGKKFAEAEKEAAIEKLNAAFKEKEATINTAGAFRDIIVNAAEQLAKIINKDYKTIVQQIQSKSEELSLAATKAPKEVPRLQGELRNLQAQQGSAGSQLRGIAQLEKDRAAQELAIRSSSGFSEAILKVKQAFNNSSVANKDFLATLEELDFGFRAAAIKIEKQFAKLMLSFSNQIAQEERKNIGLAGRIERLGMVRDFETENRANYSNITDPQEYLKRQQSISLDYFNKIQALELDKANREIEIQFKTEQMNLENIKQLIFNTEALRQLRDELSKDPALNGMDVSAFTQPGSPTENVYSFYAQKQAGLRRSQFSIAGSSESGPYSSSMIKGPIYDDIKTATAKINQMQEAAKNVASRGGDFVTASQEAAKNLGIAGYDVDEVAKTILDLANKYANQTEQFKQAGKTFSLSQDLEEKRSKAGTFKEGVTSGFIELNQRRADFAMQFGKEIPTMFADGLSNALNSAIEGAASLKDALRSAAYEFVKGINQRLMSNLVDNAVGGLGNLGFGMFQNKASGGMITGGSGSKDDVPAMLMGGEYVVNKKAVSKYGPKFLEAINNGTLNGYAKGGKVQKGPQGNFYAPGTFGQGAISGKRNLLDFATQTGTSGKFDQMINESGYQSISLEPESSRLSVSGMRNSPQFEATQSAKQQAFDLYLQQYNAEREAKKQAEEQKKALIKQVGMLALSAALGPVINAAGAGFSAAFKGASGQGFMSQVGAGFKGIVSGGTVGNQQVGGLSNLFSSAGKAFSGDFAGAANQFKMSQIGNGNQLSDLYKSDPKFASYIDSMGGINASGAPVVTNIIPEAGRFSATRPNASIPIGAVRSPSGVVLKDGDMPNRGESDVPFDELPMVLPPKPKAIGGMIPSRSGIDTVPAMLSGGEFVMNRSAVQSIGAPNLQSMNSGGTSITSEETSKELNEKLLAKLDELIGASGSTGNITINVAPSGQTSQENSQDPSASRQQLARQIKDAVLQIINDEKRIGGTLRR
jgi:TP901 family phage tail tape measure protein